MNVDYADDALRRLAEQPEENSGFDPKVVKAIRKHVQLIRAAVDPRVFRPMRSVQYEALPGNGRHWMRLDDRWRLMLEEAISDQGKPVVILSMTDSH